MIYYPFSSFIVTPINSNIILFNEIKQRFQLFSCYKDLLFKYCILYEINH